MGVAAGVLGHQQVLAVVGQLHAGAGDLDSGSRAGLFLVVRLREQRFRESDVGLRGVHVGIALDGGQVGARHLSGHLLLGGVHVGAGGGDPDLGGLIPADGAEVEDALRAADARVHGGERSHERGEAEARDGYGAEDRGIEAQGREVLGTVLVAEGGIDIRQEGGTLLERAGLRLLQSLVRKLHVGAALGRNGHLDGALQAQLQRSRGQRQAGRKQD